MQVLQKSQEAQRLVIYIAVGLLKPSECIINELGIKSRLKYSFTRWLRIANRNVAKNSHLKKDSVV